MKWGGFALFRLFLIHNWSNPFIKFHCLSNAAENSFLQGKKNAFMDAGDGLFFAGTACLVSGLRERK